MAISKRKFKNLSSRAKRGAFANMQKEGRLWKKQSKKTGNGKRRSYLGTESKKRSRRRKKRSGRCK